MNKKIVILTLSLLGVTMLHAQNIIRPKVECPNGIYVNSYNGVLFYQRPDVSVTNRNMRLEAVFYYNSSSNKKNYGYGNGWSLGSELRFVNDSLGVIIEQGDGRQDLYTRYGNSFEAPAGVFSTLSFEGDGYLLSYKDGTKYYFTDTVAKKVTMVKDRYDNAITFTYQEGNLTTASDISGRSLYFTWSNGLLSGISTSFDDRKWSYGYDENGNLASVTDPMGYTVHYAYNKDNRIKTFTDAEGYSTHISYNADGMAHRVKTDVTDKSIRYELAKRQTIFVDYFTDANNQYTKYVWDEQGRLVEIENVNTGAHTKFAYDDDNNMISREDANGNAYTYTYDENGNCTSETDPLGYTESFTYESTFNKVTSYTDKMGHYYNYHYDEHGDLVQMNGPLNYSFTMAYNEYGQPISTTDAGGNICVYTYDNYGNMSTVTDALGYTTVMTYTIGGVPLSQTLPNGAVTSFEYDNNGRLIETIDALNYSIQSQYDRKGNITNYTDAMNNTIIMIHNAIGHITKIVNPDGAYTIYEYSGNRPIRMKNALNQISSITYDDNNCVAITTDADNNVTRSVFDNIGNLVNVGMPNGENITYQYDNLGRVISAYDQLGTFFEYHYDPNDNIIQKEDAMGHSEYYAYDALNRLIQHTDATGNTESFTYDNNGNIQTYTNKNGFATVMSYDANGNLLTHTDALNNTTSYNYDSNGDLISVSDANGHTTTFEYDLLRQLKKITFPNGKTRKYWYDGNGNTIMHENEAGEQIAVSYDEMNRTISISEVDNSDTYSSYQYDLAGNMIAATNENASSTFTYDSMGRLLTENTNGRITSFYYDVTNNTVQITYPSGKQITKVHDCRSRLIEIIENGSPIASITYNNANAITARTNSIGLSTSYLYDDNGHIERLSDSRSNLDYQFIYDAEGNLITRKDLINTEASQTFGYDGLNRLISFNQGLINNNNIIPNPIKQISYELDGLGNLTSLVSNGFATTYTTNEINAYSTINSGGLNHNLYYDDKGNLIDDGEHIYEYDAQNKLHSVDHGNVVLYKYDALNRLISKEFPERGGESIMEYLCYAGAEMIEEFASTGYLSSSYTYGLGPKDIVRSIIGGACYYYEKDQNGSIVTLVNDNASRIEQYQYDPYGNISFFDGQGNPLYNSTIGNNFLYGGMNMDGFTGSYFDEGRVLNTSQGRYNQKDPAIYASSMNTYTNNGALKNQFDWDKNLMSMMTDGWTILSQVPKALYDGGLQNTFNGVFGNKQFTYQGGYYINKNGELALTRHHNQYTQTFQNQANTMQKIGAGMEIGLALIKIPSMVKKVGQTNSFAEEWSLYGDYATGLLTTYFPVFAPVDMVWRKFTGKGIFEASAEGWGMIADLGMDALENGCERFKQNGYENSNWFQKQFAKVADNLPHSDFFYETGLPDGKWLVDTLIKKPFRKGYEIGQKLFPVKK